MPSSPVYQGSGSVMQSQHASRWHQPPRQSTHSMLTRSATHDLSSSHTLEGNEIELAPKIELSSSEQTALSSFFDRFQSKEFMLHETAGLPSFIVQNTYKAEEEIFIKHCSMVHHSKVPLATNKFRSHVLYKIKKRRQ